jgi:hypothetical protein
MPQERDYAGDMRTVMDRMAHGVYSPPLVAIQIVNWLQQNDPELLDGWLHQQAHNMIRAAINQRDSSARTYNRIHSRRSVFQRAAVAAGGGDTGPLSNFIDEVYSIESGEKKPLGLLYHNDLIYVAKTYEDRERENGLQKAFLRALADRVGDQQVSDVFDNVDLAKLWNSIT